MDRFKRRALYSWAFIAALAGLSVALAFLQYSWIGEVSRAEQERLRANLHGTLERLRTEFNSNISQAAHALALPEGDWPQESTEREALYIQRFKRWREGNHEERLFSNIVRIVPGKDGTVTLRLLDQQRFVFRSVEWPANWDTLRNEVLRSTANEEGPRRPPHTGDLDVILLPLFEGRREGPGPRQGPPPMEPRGRQAPLEWIVFELDLNYVRAVLMPELMEQLTRAVGTGYDVELVSRNDPGAVIYQSDAERTERIGGKADAQVVLFDVQPKPPTREGPGGGPPPRGPDLDPLRGRWLLSVRHRAGSLDAVVAQTRWKNIAVTTAVLGLMLLTIGALVRFTRRAQALSQLQMQFVAGVSHELRTPLTVIRTAAHNLSTGIVKPGDVNQIHRYGQLIAGQTDKLTALVEQVLGFANAEAGRVITRREAVAVEALIADALAESGSVVAEARCAVESSVAGDVPPVLGDPMALRHALQNLITNAAKYGADGGWIGVAAKLVTGAKSKPMIEITVTDKGAGIPDEERGLVFEPFYRGRRAIDDQVHGTGLGLALVKRIVEAHGGTIEVKPGPLQQGTQFTLRIPAAPPEQIDEFADIISRG